MNIKKKNFSDILKCWTNFNPIKTDVIYFYIVQGMYNVLKQSKTNDKTYLKTQSKVRTKHWVPLNLIVLEVVHSKRWVPLSLIFLEVASISPRMQDCDGPSRHRPQHGKPGTSTESQSLHYPPEVYVSITIKKNCL
jgi:hypothetical protein